MKSKICFVNDDNEFILDIKKKIKELINNNDAYSSNYHSSNTLYITLLYAKYIVEKYELDLEDILNDKTEELFKHMNFKDYLNVNMFFTYKIYKLLKYIIYEDYYINESYDKVVDNYIENDKKYLVVGLPKGYLNYPNLDFFITTNDIEFQMIDEILGIKRNYYNYQNEPVFNYDAAIIYSNIYSLPLKKEALRITNYEYISKISWVLKKQREISKFIVDKNSDIAYFIYRPGDYNEFINILNITNLTSDEIRKVIKTNKEIKDVSINVSFNTIRKNYDRIGFSFYNREKVSKIDEEIIKLLDENDNIVRDIDAYNSQISRQMNNIIFK